MPVSTYNFPYYNTVDQIYHAEWSLAKLARHELLRRSIAALWPEGHPTKLIHVAGTGGKGSTCRFLELGFGCIGKAGAFMSSHLFDYLERLRIGGEGFNLGSGKPPVEGHKDDARPCPGMVQDHHFRTIL